MLPNVFQKNVTSTYILEQIYYTDEIGAAMNWTYTFTGADLKVGGRIRYIIVSTNASNGGSGDFAFYDNGIKMSPTMTGDNVGDKTYTYTFLIKNPNMNHVISFQRIGGAGGLYSSLIVTVGREV